MYSRKRNANKGLTRVLSDQNLRQKTKLTLNGSPEPSGVGFLRQNTQYKKLRKSITLKVPSEDRTSDQTKQKHLMSKVERLQHKIRDKKQSNKLLREKITSLKNCDGIGSLEENMDEFKQALMKYLI